MAYLFRLIVAMGLLFAGSAHALIPAVSGLRVNDSGILSEYIYDSMEAACLSPHAQQVAVIKTAPFGWTGEAKYIWQGAFGCVVFANGDVQRAIGGLRVETGTNCPANSNAVSQTSCQCNTGTVEVAGRCVIPPKSCQGGKVYREASTRPLGTGSAMPNAGISALMQGVPSCDDGCAVAGGALRAERGLDKNTWTLIVPQLLYTGGQCTESNKDLDINTKWDTAQEKDKEPSPCATGKCPGTVNGVNVCMPCTASATPSSESSSSTGPKSTTGGANGDGSGGGEGGPGGPVVIGEGGPSKANDTKITVCDGTTCTTTTTKTGTAGAGSGTGAGGSTGNSSTDCAKAAASSASSAAGGATCTETKTETKSQAQFCKENPKNASCSNDPGQSSFGGNCASGFVATGDDAVLNALAKEQFQQNCRVNPDQESTELARAERVKTGDQTGDNPNNSEVALSSASFDTSDALNAGSSCIADKTISVFGGSAVTLPFSRACDGFPLLGGLLMALSFLVAGVIVLRG